MKVMYFVFIHVSFHLLVLHYGSGWSYGSSETVDYLVWITWKLVVFSLKDVCTLQSFFTKHWQNVLHIKQTWQYAIFVMAICTNLTHKKIINRNPCIRTKIRRWSFLLKSKCINQFYEPVNFRTTWRHLSDNF